MGRRRDYIVVMEKSEALKDKLGDAVKDLPRSSITCLDGLGWTGTGFRYVPNISKVVQALQAHSDVVAAAAMKVTTQDAATQTDEIMEVAQTRLEEEDDASLEYRL